MNFPKSILIMKNSNLILVQEPFLLDDELREKVTK